MNFDLFTHLLEVVTLVLLSSCICGAAIGTWLAERHRDYRLPYEQKSHVRLLRDDES